MQDGRPVGVQGIARDVTDRRRPRKRCATQHEQQQIMLDSVPAMMVYADTAGRIMRINKAAARCSTVRSRSCEGRLARELAAAGLAAFLRPTSRRCIEQAAAVAGVRAR